MIQNDDAARFRSTLAYAGRRLLPVVIEASESAGNGRACGPGPSPHSRGAARASRVESLQSSRARAAAVATYELLAEVDQRSARSHVEHRQ